MSIHIEILNQDTVITVNNSKQLYLVENTTFRVTEFLCQVKENYSGVEGVWLGSGVECEVLTPNKNWRKGKLKLSLVFCPNESEVSNSDEKDSSNQMSSPLDEIRKFTAEES